MDPQPSAPTPKTDAPKPVARLEIPDTPQPKGKLQLPKDLSPGQSIQDSLKATRPSGPRAIGGGGQIPGGGARGGGGTRGTVYGGPEMLTPDEGVDVKILLQRLYD